MICKVHQFIFKISIFSLTLPFIFAIMLGTTKKLTNRCAERVRSPSEFYLISVEVKST